MNYIDCQLLLNNKHVNYPMPTSRQMNNYYFDEDEGTHKVFGAYDEHGILNACVFSTYSVYDRSWIIEYIVKQPFATKETLFSTVRAAINYAEDNNYYRFSIFYFDNEDIVWERFMSNDIIEPARYNICIEETIPIGRRSSFDKYWNRLQKRIAYPRLIKIKEYSLKDEYRIFNR